MKYVLNLNTENRILSATYPQFNISGIQVDSLPDGNIADYKYISGQYVYDPLPKPAEPKPDPGEQYVTFNDLDKALSKGVNSI